MGNGPDEPILRTFHQLYHDPQSHTAALTGGVLQHSVPYLREKLHPLQHEPVTID